MRQHASLGVNHRHLADLTRLVAQWGGVTIAYRKGLIDSPAYRLNHEEVAKCLEEGIVIAEGLSPVEAVPDQHGAVKAVRFALQKQVEGKWCDAGEVVELPARTVCIAAGTSPNVTLEKESPGIFELDAKHGSFRAYRFADGQVVPASFTQGRRFAFIRPDAKLLGKIEKCRDIPRRVAIVDRGVHVDREASRLGRLDGGDRSVENALLAY